MSKLKNLEDLFKHELQDLYSAEKQLIAALPKMAEAAKDSSLKKAFESHLEETKGHKARLENIFELLDMSKGTVKCKAMEGLVEEGSEMIDENATPETKDAGLIAAAQRVEHYEMAGYGTAHHYAQKLGHAEVAKILEQTLTEEKNADAKLNTIAKAIVNPKAMEAVK